MVVGRDFFLLVCSSFLFLCIGFFGFFFLVFLSFVKIYSRHCLSQTVSSRELKLLKNVHPPPHATCHMSCVIYHVSCVTCHILRVLGPASHVFFFNLLLPEPRGAGLHLAFQFSSARSSVRPSVSEIKFWSLHIH